MVIRVGQLQIKLKSNHGISAHANLSSAILQSHFLRTGKAE